jgi:hypothetical protein
MTPIDWKLSEVIATHGLTPLQVEREAQRLGYAFGTNTIYRLIRGDGPRLVDRESLAAVVAALRSLTGEAIDAGDLLMYKP